jgi:hypothetical protein
MPRAQSQVVPALLRDQAELATAMSEAGLGAPLLNINGGLVGVNQFVAGDMLFYYRWRSKHVSDTVAGFSDLRWASEFDAALDFAHSIGADHRAKLRAPLPPVSQEMIQFLKLNVTQIV